ncbi:hypothetical protein G7Y79_00006g019280 [Physcia stellaris]|nr:hypothetical protein G7Y79_00006g019280 [Physcia stellaris]
MLDPITSIGLAGNIVQFIDFSWGLLRETKDLYNSSEGTTADIDVLESISNNIIDFDDTLIAPSAAGAIPQQMRELASQCKEIAQELLLILDKRLERLRDQMQSRLQWMLFEKNSDIQRTLDKLVTENKNLNVDAMQGIEREYQAVQQALKQLQSESKLQTTALKATKQAIRQEAPVEAPTTPAWVDDMKDLFVKLSSLAKEVESTASDQMLLRSLYFKDIRTRETQVASSHEATFKWLLDPGSPTNVTEWLESQNGIFWVTGKPGSGKSTLMKYLVAHPHTMHLLRSWAGTRRLVTASFYFWHAGTTIQKSQEGLFRSLLYEILSKCPDLIHTVCRAKSATFRPFENEVEPWTLQELQQAIEQLPPHSEMQIQFCFFIDGLDEYDGHPDDIVKVLESLETLPNIKLCVSSRPWNEFLDAFGQDSHRYLALENLTREDIKGYVKDSLETNSRFALLKQRDARSQNLMDEIVEKASGVFLWVTLVTRSLLDGLRHADRISDLQRRLREFPETLEKYFKHIVFSIDGVYRGPTAESFTYVLEAANLSAEPISLLTFSFLDEDDLDGCITTTKTKPLRIEDISIREEDMRRRLNGRCKGLLEVLKGTMNPEKKTYDFLATKDMQSMLKSNLKPDFKPLVHLCKAYLAQLKAIDYRQLTPNQEQLGTELLEDMLFYARAIELKLGVSPITLLDEAELLVTRQKKFFSGFLKAGTSFVFLPFLIKRELHLYVNEVLRKRPQLEPRDSSALLEVAVDPSETKYFDATYDPKMIAILLENGASHEQAWSDLLKSLATQRALGDNEKNETRLQVVELFLRHGADPQHRVTTSETTRGPRQDSGRAADLYKRSSVRSETASAYEIITVAFGEEKARRLLGQARIKKKSFLSKMMFWGSG